LPVPRCLFPALISILLKQNLVSLTEGGDDK